MDHCVGLHGYCSRIWVDYLSLFHCFNKHNRFIFMMLTRYCAKVIVWLFIVSFIVILILLGAIYIMKAENVTLNL